MLRVSIIFVPASEKLNCFGFYCYKHRAIDRYLYTVCQYDDLVKIYHNVRQRIARCCELESPLPGAVEVDESYFGAQCIRGKRSRGAYGKTIVFDVLECPGKVYTESVPDCFRTTLQAIIRRHVAPDTIIHSDG